MVKKRKKIGKKGNVLDVFYIVLFVFIFAIITLFAYKVVTEAQPKIDAKANNDVSLNVSESARTAIASFDWILILIIVGLVVATAIGAYFINTHPVFFVASLLLLCLLLVLIPAFTNAFDKFASHGSMAETAETFTITTSFFDELPTYFFIMSCIVLIALYAKYRGGGGET
jgi:hypothetical protein